MKTKNNQTFVSIDYNNQSFEKNKTSPCIHQTLIFSLGAFTLTTTASLYLHQIMESTNFNLAEFLAKILVFLPILTLVYVFTRNCSKTDKHISVLYFKFAIFSGILGILLSIYLRFSEVIAFNNFLKCTNYAFYEIVFCGCTVILAFFFCMSVLLGGFGIRYVPVLLGRSRTYFPKINYISYILLILSFSMFILSLGFAIFSQNDLVINLSYLKVYIVDFLIWSLYLFGMSYFLLSINLILTIGKGLKRIIPPLFVQTMMVTSILMLCFIPLLIGIVTKTLLVSQLNFMNFNIVIENSTGGKEILSWAYLFWCGVHPAIFIFILPTLGIISQIVTYHYKPNNSNYITLSINICLMGITGVSYCGFYLFTLNKIINIESYFFFLQLIVIYSILAFNVSLLFTLRGASINTLNTSSLFVIGCILTFFINASCEFVLSIYKGKQILFDGFFLETQLQYLLFISVLYAIFAGIYFCFKDIFGVSYNETLGRIHFWSFFFGTNLTFFPMYFLGTPQKPIIETEIFYNFLNLSFFGFILYLLSFINFLIVILEGFLTKRNTKDLSAEFKDFIKINIPYKKLDLVISIVFSFYFICFFIASVLLRIKSFIYVTMVVFVIIIVVTQFPIANYYFAPLPREINRMNLRYKNEWPIFYYVIQLIKVVYLGHLLYLLSFVESDFTDIKLLQKIAYISSWENMVVVLFVLALLTETALKLYCFHQLGKKLN